MKKQLLHDLTRAIKRNTQTKTLKELEHEGKSQVKVIQESQITRLISQAVETALEARNIELGKGERDFITQASMDEFRRLVKDAGEGNKENFKNLERLRGEDARRMEEQQMLIESLRTTIEDLKNTPPPESSLIDQQALLSELRDLREENRKLRTEPQIGGDLAKQMETLFTSKMESLASMLAQQFQYVPMEKQGNPVEAAQIMLDNLFGDEGQIESNLVNLEVKSAKGAGIGGNLERLKKLNAMANKVTEERSS